jgi:acetylornithine deacetylase/succinyl-diaminopimelate desuccinylase-like protein
MKSMSLSCMRMWLMGVALVCATACATSTADASPPKQALPTSLQSHDFGVAAQHASTSLSAYLQVDTRNPPGNEADALQFLRALVEPMGLKVDVINHSERRQSMIARWTADAPDGTPPLCLTHHMDVVTTEDERWQPGAGPLSGARVQRGGEEVVVGRGALDMKGTGIAHLEALRVLQQSGLPRKRDIVLLAVADEEVKGAGMLAAVSDEHWPKIGCSHALNEGGLGLKDAITPGQTVFGVSVGERGVLWIRVVAQGAPGHGSTPVAGRAPDRLLAAMTRMDAFEAGLKPRIHPALRSLLATSGAASGGLQGWAMQQDWLVDNVIVGRLQNKPTTRAITNDTLELTGFGGAEQPNVVPGEVFAQYDVRLLPGTTSADMLSRIRAHLSDLEGVRVDVIETKEAGESEWRDDELFASLLARAADGDTSAIVAPVISPGFTDSIVLRTRGVRAYGLMPIAVTGAQSATIHGDDEHISVSNLERAIRTLAFVLADVAVAKR